MVFDVLKREGSGLMMDVNYTLSRQTGDTTTNFGESYDFSFIQNLEDMGLEAHTLSPYDQLSVVKGFVSYQLPFGRGRLLARDSGGVLNAIVNNWTVAGLFSYATGQPITFSAPNPYYPQWAGVYVNYNLSGYKGNTFKRSTFDPNGGAGNQYFPVSIASAPAYGQLGTGRQRISAMRCPGIPSEDADLLKDFPAGHDGRYDLQLRAEFYNIFNRHSYFLNGCEGSSAVPTSSNFGQVVGVTGSPRTGQLAVRFTF